MAYVPNEVLKCVVFLGFIDKKGNEKFGGSAFWISRSIADKEKATRFEYLVTAAHVIDDMRERMDSANNRVRVRVNLKEGTQKWEDTPLHLWKVHPEYPRVDLAVFRMDINEAWDHVSWPSEYYASKESIDNNESDRKLELGDELFLSGLFWPHKGNRRNIPIVRVGNIAALRDEPVLNKKDQQMDAYLVESRSIGGLSGSPVFIDLMTAKLSLAPSGGYMAAAYSGSSPWRFRLVGVMHGHFDWDDTEPDFASGQAGAGVNMGIAIVIPAENVLEAINTV